MMNIQKFSDKQTEAIKLLNSRITNVMVYGGRRSGKTYLIISWIVAICLRFSNLKSLIARKHLSHVKASIWDETLPRVLKDMGLVYGIHFTMNISELRLQFINGSEIRCVGYDSKERIEKLLGTEYAIIFNNECSTLDIQEIRLASSSLAQNIPGFHNKIIYDMNPPSPRHWTYKLFIQKLIPESQEDKTIKDPHNWIHIKINPLDNPRLKPSYIKQLESLPERDRKRLLDGEFVKPDGLVYYNFDLEDHTIDLEQCPQFETYAVGVDTTGNNLAAILIGFAGDSVYILDEYTAYMETITNFNSTIYHKWGQYRYVAYCDPAAPQLNQQITWNQPGDNSVVAGIDCVRQLIHNRNFFIVKTKDKYMTQNLLSELELYRYDNKGRIVKDNDHVCDAMRYCIYTHRTVGASILGSN